MLVIVTVLAALSAWTPADADTQPAAVPIVRALEARYHNAKTLKAVFLQRHTDSQQGLQAESGTVYFSRPGRMRWEYESPEPQLFVTDGKTDWSFVPADHTVTRTLSKESGDLRTPLALLTGNVKLSQLCGSIELAKESPGTPGDAVLRCLPRGQKRAGTSASPASDANADIASSTELFDQVLLEVSPATGELADVRVFEPGGIIEEFSFENWQEGLPLKESLFRFVVPRVLPLLMNPTCCVPRLSQPLFSAEMPAGVHLKWLAVEVCIDGAKPEC